MQTVIIASHIRITIQEVFNAKAKFIKHGASGHEKQQQWHEFPAMIMKIYNFYIETQIKVVVLVRLFASLKASVPVKQQDFFVTTTASVDCSKSCNNKVHVNRWSLLHSHAECEGMPLLTQDKQLSNPWENWVASSKNHWIVLWSFWVTLEHHSIPDFTAPSLCLIFQSTFHSSG